MGQEGFKLDWSWVALLFSHKKRPRRSGAKLRLLWANLGGCGLQWVLCLRQWVPFFLWANFKVRLTITLHTLLTPLKR